MRRVGPGSVEVEGGPVTVIVGSVEGRGCKQGDVS